MWKLLLFMFGILISAAAEQSAAGSETNASLSVLERKFSATFANATLYGRWCNIEKGKMTEEYHDEYTIQRATKSGKDRWLIYARIEYGGHELTVPVPVQLKWAGDTPVITLDKVSLPGLGTYSARVLIYENTYAGTWFAKDHGGMLHGTIEKLSRNSAGPEKK